MQSPFISCKTFGTHTVCRAAGKHTTHSIRASRLCRQATGPTCSEHARQRFSLCCRVHQVELQSSGMVHIRMSLPVANVKLVPKNKPEAAALFKPYFSTPFTAALYLSQAAFSLANERTCHKPYSAEAVRQTRKPRLPLAGLSQMQLEEV